MTPTPDDETAMLLDMIMDEVVSAVTTLPEWAVPQQQPQAWIAVGHAQLRRADMAVARAEGFPATRWSHPDDTYREQMVRTAAICLAAISHLDGPA